MTSVNNKDTRTPSVNNEDTIKISVNNKDTRTASVNNKGNIKTSVKNKDIRMKSNKGTRKKSGNNEVTSKNTFSKTFNELKARF